MATTLARRRISPVCSTAWLLLLTLGFSACTLATQVPPRFVLDLDKPPSERWRGAVELVLASHSFESGFGETFAQYNKTLYDNLKPHHWKLLVSALAEHFPEQAEELAGLAKEFQKQGHYVSVEYLAGWVFSHELGHTDLLIPSQRSEISKSCTGIVVEDADGSILHGANMDQSPKAVRKLTLAVDIMQKGAVIMSGVDWYWFTTGVTRVVRKGVAALSEDWRGLEILDHRTVFEAIRLGAVPQVFLYRTVLQKYSVGWSDGLVEVLRSVRMAAPMYIIAAGPASGQGVVIARSPTSSDGDLHLGAGPEPWFIVQSNYEPWQPDPLSDPRRSAAIASLRQFGQPAATSPLGLFAVLSAFPVNNPNTAYTTVMRPASGEVHAFVRDASCPETRADAPFPDPRYCQRDAVEGVPRQGAEQPSLV